MGGKVAQCFSIADECIAEPAEGVGLPEGEAPASNAAGAVGGGADAREAEVEKDGNVNNQEREVEAAVRCEWCSDESRCMSVDTYSCAAAAGWPPLRRGGGCAW